SAAQIKPMKSAAGTLKIDLAQYRELEAFSKFGADLDAVTKSILDKGARNVEVLKQPQYTPYPVEKQVAIIYLSTNNLLREVPQNRVREFEQVFLTSLEKRHPEVLAQLREKKGEITADLASKLTELAKECALSVSK
ncbi:MAG TPA: F0F1 ATP synthase subunit alpha, partial [Chitinophagales bacterium]|nr:F0F1 ATP synthase subunit alpha [Chitinophagales bacterium]